MTAPKLLLTTSPFLKHEDSTPFVMTRVILALLPVSLAAVYYFGMSALLVIVATVLGAMFTEYMTVLSGHARRNTLWDGSAALTGLLLALTLPPGIPLWMAFLGGVVSIAIGKLIFGGLGGNVFNPSLVGRAFLQAAFPVTLTTWASQSNLDDLLRMRGDHFSIPFMKSHFDGISSATPLSQMKFEGKLAQLSDLFMGNISGSLGETSALIILLGGVYLFYKKAANWRIPLAVFIGAYAFAGALHFANPEKFVAPMYHLFSGGLMLGAIFMATDPVTSPVTQRGCWIFGLGIGVLVIIIRTFGGLPEGVMYAILFMNALTPVINRYTHPRIYGEQKRKPVKEAKS